MGPIAAASGTPVPTRPAGGLPGGLSGRVAGDAAKAPTAETLARIDVVPPAAMPQPGETAELAVVFRIEPKWHIYWRNSGDSGLPPTIDVVAPDGWTVGPIRWPRPTRFSSPDETTFGYEGAVVLFVPLTAPAEPSKIGSTADFTVDIGWMVCKGVCLTGRTTRRATMPGMLQSAPLPAIIEASRRRLPRPLADAHGATVSIEGDDPTARMLVVEGPAEGASRVDFLPFATPGVSYGAARSTIADRRYRLVVPLTIAPGNALGGRLEAAGLVALDTNPAPIGGGPSALPPDGPTYEFSLPVAAP